MGESSKKRQWLDCPYINPDVYQLSQILSSKPTEESLETLHTYLKDDSNLLRRNDARSLFLYYIAKCNTNKPLKNDFMNKITNSKEDFTLFSSIIIECVKDLLFDFEIEQTLLSSRNIVFLLPVVNTFFQICLEKDNEKVAAVLEIILPLYDIILDTFVQQLRVDFEETYNFKNEDLLSLAGHTMKQVLWIFVKRPDSNIDSYVLAFLDYSYRVLSYEKIALDLKSKSGLIFVHCLGRLPEEELDQFVFKEHPMLEVTNEPEDKENWICGKNFKFTSLLDSNSARVVLFSALYNCIDVGEQLNLILANGKCVFQAIFEEMLCCADRPMRDNAEIVEVTRNLLLISESLCKVPVPLYNSLFERSLSYVSAFCEYHMDAVQKNATLFLGHIIRTACHHLKNGTDMFLRHLLSSVNLKEGKRKIDFVTIMYLCTYMKCSFLLQNIQNLQEQITQLLEDPVCHEHACTTYELLMREHYKEIPLEQWLSTWVRPALAQLRRVHIDKTEVYQRIICRAFQINQAILRDLFPNKYMGSHREWGVLLKCLCYARNSKNTLKIGTYDSSIYWWGLIEKAKLKMFAVQRDDMVRVSALKVVIECRRTTEYYTEWEFSYLIDYYILNGSNQVPSIRKQVISLYLKGINRFFASLDVILKQLENLKRKQAQKNDPANEEWISNFTKLQKCYMNFLGQFTSLLISNIAPDGNFYRRNSALELLMYLQPLVDKQEWEDWWKSDDMDNLKQILQDSYELNKKMAITLLSKFDPEKFKFDDSNYYASYFSEALLFASDIKPSKSLSAAYMFQLCCYSPVLFESDETLQNYGQENEMVLNIIILLTSELLSKLSDNFDDLGEAAMNSPCYGILLCLRYLIRYRRKGIWNSSYASTFALIFSISQRIFKIVLPIVSNPAPEGYLPENDETEINIRDDTVKSQRILVYAWRTVKEITLLFSEFVSQDMELEEHRVLSFDDYIEIGEHFMELFVQAKHRGVFEQAYVGFCILCECYWRSPNRNLSCLPNKWLRRGLDLVTGTKVDDRLCSTRRSAGMPFLIMAILTTDPSLDKASFHTTMSELTIVAQNLEDDKIEYRTHSLNILRFLFRHTKLGDHVSPYIEKSAELALKGMRSHDWGIRNSSTLLFSALVTGLFGVQRTQESEEVTVKNEMTVKVFCSRFPTLFGFLLDTLKTGCENNNSLVLHPILLVFSRLYPGHLDPSDTKIEEAIPYIKKCMASSSVETRRLAARASMALVFPRDLHLTIKQNFEKIALKQVGNNECHGLLLEVWHILKFVGDQMDLQIGKIISSSIYVLENAGNRFSHHCVSLYMDILSFLFGKYQERVDLDTLRRILTSISRLMEEQNINITGRRNFEAAMVNLTITILLIRLEHVETTFQAINFDFENYMMVHEGMIMKTYCLHFVLYVNLTYNEMDLQDPPLYIFEELKPPESVRDVINNFNKPTKCEFLTYIHKFMVGYLRGELERIETVSVNECFILNLLLLSYYPCLLVAFNRKDKQKTMDMLINFCSCDREEVISAVISCIGVLLSQLDNDTLKSLDYRRLIRLLRRSAAPEAAVYRRLAVCQFLLKCKFLFYPGPKFMKATSLVHFLSMVMTLLEDEALRIRNEISALTDDENIVLLDEQSKSGWKCSPDKSRYDFLKHCCKILPKQLCIAFLLAWSIRHFPDASNDSSDVFERSELNTYAENIPHIQIVGKMLTLMLWSIPYDLNYEDKSIFIEEQCQMVTTILLDAVSKHSFPMVERKTKVSVICAFRSILTYLDLNHVCCNFKYKFSEYFQKKILLYFRKQVCRRDYDSVKKIFLILYHPVLFEIEYK